MSRRSMRTQKEWKVAISGLAREVWPSSFSTRSAISAEALLVKVTARMESGATPFSLDEPGDAVVMTRVLPEPAPARMSTGPSVASTAARCSGFRLSMSGCTADRSRREGFLLQCNVSGGTKFWRELAARWEERRSDILSAR